MVGSGEEETHLRRYHPTEGGRGTAGMGGNFISVGSNLESGTDPTPSRHRDPRGRVESSRKTSPVSRLVEGRTSVQEGVLIPLPGLKTLYF